jgi:Ca2+-binding EF-hand superfamily protein
MTRFAFSAAALAIAIPTAATAEPKSKEEAFRSADANGDRVLSASELKVFIGHMADLGQPRAKRVRLLGLYGLAMRTIDTDKDGVASIAELRKQD